MRVLLVLFFTAVIVTGAFGAGLRHGLSGFTTTGYYFHIHDTIDSEYGSFSGSLVPVGLSFGYSVGAIFFGAGFDYLAGMGDYESLASPYIETRFFFRKEAKFSPCASVAVGPHFLTDYVGVMARVGAGMDYRASNNFGGYAEVGYLGVLPDVYWAGDHSYWIGNVGLRVGMAATF
jgi:hypothetical protein